MHTGIDISA